MEFGGGPAQSLLGRPHCTPRNLCPTCLQGLPNFCLPLHACCQFCPPAPARRVGAPGPRARQPVRSASGRSPVPARWWPAGLAPAGPRPLAGCGPGPRLPGPSLPRSYTRTHTHMHTSRLHTCARTRARTHTHATSLPASWAQRRRPGKRCFAPALPGHACGLQPQGSGVGLGPSRCSRHGDVHKRSGRGTFSGCCAGLPSTQIYTVFTKREVTRVHATWPPRRPTL